jgi:poly(A) polymerase
MKTAQALDSDLRLVLTAAIAAPSVHNTQPWLFRARPPFIDVYERRDFTINGLFFDVERGEILDYVGGLRDLERGVIETIGDPWTRFREDPVRMLRAIKFAGRLGLRLADDVFQALVDCGADIQKAAAPRILEEITRLLERGGAEHSTRLLYKTGLFHILIPEVAEPIEHALGRGRLPPMWECFGHLDELARRGADLPMHTMLSVLFLELFDEAIYDPDSSNLRRDLPVVIESVLRPIGIRLRMSRRDLYLIKQVLLAQRLFTGAAKSRKRRGTVAALLDRDHFGAAWLLFRTQSEVTGRYQAQRHAWEERLEQPPYRN